MSASRIGKPNSGRFTLIVAVDQITDEPKRVVPYINSHTVTEVQFLALEIEYMKDEDVELVRPVTYGAESVAEKRGSGQRHLWSPESYFEKLRGYEAPVQNAIDELVRFSKEHGAEFQGGSGTLPSLSVQFKVGDKKKTLWSSYYYGDGPTFDLNFDYIRPLFSIEALRRCAHTLEKIDGVAAIYERLEPDYKARPSIPSAFSSRIPPRWGS